MNPGPSLQDQLVGGQDRIHDREDQRADKAGDPDGQRRREQGHQPLDAPLALLLQHHGSPQQHLVELAGFLSDCDHPQGDLWDAGTAG